MNSPKRGHTPPVRREGLYLHEICVELAVQVGLTVNDVTGKSELILPTGSHSIRNR